MLTVELESLILDPQQLKEYLAQRAVKGYSHPTIVCAANAMIFEKKRETFVYLVLGARHFDKAMVPVIQKIRGEAMAMSYTEVAVRQGFIDQFVTFYSRQAAYELCVSSGRVLNPRGSSTPNNTSLYSEHLY